MESRAIVKVSVLNHNVRASVIPGHFATNHSHTNYFVDLTEVKSMHKMAKAAGEIFASKYSGTPIDTILCLERTKMVATFLADKISERGLNQGQDIAVITPELSNGQLILRDNMQHLVYGKNVLIMFANVTTGLTAETAIDGIRYYGGSVVGIASLYSMREDVNGVKVNSIFSMDDLPNYETHSKNDCPLCKNRIKLDALINSYGYSKL